MKTTTFNGCSYSDIWVHPKNWKTSKNNDQNWYIQCIFFDPNFSDKYPNGFPWRKRINRIPTLEGKKQAVKILINEMDILLKDKGYNPITGEFNAPKWISNEITPDTQFIHALEQAYKNLDVSESTIKDIKSMLKYFSKSAKLLLLDDMPVGQVSRKYIVRILENIFNINKSFSNNRYNKYTMYLSMIYSRLIEVEAVEFNPIRDIRKRKTIKNLREVLSNEDRERVKTHLEENYPEFYRFMIIFFHSGGRIKELLSIKAKDIDLKNQTYKVTIHKGKQPKVVIRVIKDIALPYWKDALRFAPPEAYVFSDGLKFKLKETPIRRDQISKRWKVHVKDKLGITADFYSLKHTNLDETTAILGMEDAAAMASHTSTEMLQKYYAVGETQRQQERLKKIANEF